MENLNHIKPYYTPRTSAANAGVCERTWHTERKAGRGPLCYRVGNRLFVRPEDQETWKQSLVDMESARLAGESA